MPWSCWYFELHITSRFSESHSTNASDTVLDGVAQTDVGGLGALDQPHLLGDVDGDADKVGLGAARLDELGAGAQPHPAPVGVMHANMRSTVVSPVPNIASTSFIRSPSSGWMSRLTSP